MVTTAIGGQRAVSVVGGNRQNVRIRPVTDGEIDERVECFQVIGPWRSAQAMVQRMLTERTLRAIDRGEDLVQIQICPIKD